MAEPKGKEVKQDSVFTKQKEFDIKTLSEQVMKVFVGVGIKLEKTTVKPIKKTEPAPKTKPKLSGPENPLRGMTSPYAFILGV